MRNINNSIYNSRFAINCDWLQLHVKHEAGFLTNENPYFTFRRSGQSKVFSEIYEIRSTLLNNKIIAYYCTGAQSCIMPESEGVIKFENSELYSHYNLKEYVEDVLKKCFFRIIGVTRLDIAFDFQSFAGGFLPQHFIKGFLMDKFVKVQKGRAKFGVYGIQESGINTLESITFGSRSSNIMARLYNKTAELKDNCKPWIEREHQNTFENDLPVWRLEFSISSMAAFFKRDGKELDFYDLRILDAHNLYGIFQGLFTKYFRFKVRKKRLERVTRMKDLNLWHFDLPDLKTEKIMKSTLLRGGEKKYKERLRQFEKDGIITDFLKVHEAVIKNPLLRQSSRTEKIFINKLESS